MILNEKRTLELLLAIVLFVNVLAWFYARDFKARWINVPPAPGEAGAVVLTLGDKQMAYRALGLMLQNLGDMGGRSTALKDYDYGELTKWFFLMDRLDPVSDFVPFLAAYYFGSSQDPEKLRPMLDYLLTVGRRPEGEKWRWLAQGVFLARYQMKDMDKALELAHVLAEVENEDMPGWARQMPGFVLAAKGEKEAAYAIMMETLKSSADKLHPAEVNYMREYICTRILDEDEARGHSLCQDIP